MKYILLLFLLGCGQSYDSKPTINPLDILKAKSQSYREQIVSVQDQYGFVEYHECDSLLFSSLTNVNLLVTSAEVEGKWFRRPVTYQECYEHGHSKSTISRDMLLGVMYYSLISNRPDILERMWDYGTANNWIMGEGNISRTIMSPQLITTLAQARYKLDGFDVTVRHIPSVWGSPEGFEAHLQVLHVYIKGLIHGSLTEGELNAVKHQVNRVPSNPFFNAVYSKFVDGDQSKAIELLLSYPDKLPTSADWCSPWKIERDPGGDWEPCPEENRQHSGGDLIFVSRIIEY